MIVKANIDIMILARCTTVQSRLSTSAFASPLNEVFNLTHSLAITRDISI
jgi:hypothetical protein